MTKTSFIASRLAAPLLLTALTAALSGAAGAADEATVVTLTQTGCQFLEAEGGIDRGFAPATAEDCMAENGRSGAARLAGSTVLTLKPGRYIFRVSNADVPYELGFWLRSQDYNPANPLHRLTRTSVSGGGLTEGVSKDYEVELSAGSYLYSCPLNPTPDYRIVVDG